MSTMGNQWEAHTLNIPSHTSSLGAPSDELRSGSIRTQHKGD